MAVPVQWVAERLDLPATVVLVAAVFALIGGALALLSALLAERPARERAILLLSALLAMAVMSLPDFSQREHLCLIVAIPYTALLARRVEGLPTPAFLALAAGLLGASGFALKHYFVAVPLLLELWLVARLKGAWRPFRPETVALALSAAAYAAAVLIATPEFLNAMVPIVNAAYEGYETSLLAQIGTGHVGVWLIGAYVLWKQRGRFSALTVAFAIVAFAFALSYFAQQKGWKYHALPANGALVMVATLLAGGLWKDAQLSMRACIAACLLIPFIPFLVTGTYRNYHAPVVHELLEDVAPGAPAAILTSNPPAMWPMVEDAGLAWPLRYFTHWMVPHIDAVRKRHGSLPPDLQLLADRIRAETVHDFACHPPELILVDDMSLTKDRGLDLLAFFNESSAFRDYFSHYEKERVLLIYTAYRKQAGWKPERPSGCRTLHGPRAVGRIDHVVGEMSALEKSGSPGSAKTRTMNTQFPDPTPRRKGQKSANVTATAPKCYASPVVPSPHCGSEQSLSLLKRGSSERGT